MAKVLYICYFGLREPLVQTQVIPYLLEVLKDGHTVDLLTFEPDAKQKWSATDVETERAYWRARGIGWHHLAYHKWPSVPATFYDILNGIRTVKKLIARERYDLLHCRVHLPTLIGALARKLSHTRPKILFDIRGFFPEEYTDAGIWPENGWLFKTVKRVERWLLKEADGFVVLTEKARDILFPESKDTGLDKSGRPVEVIPCCVDQERFVTADRVSRVEVRQEIAAVDRFVMVYAGSFGGWYLTDEMLDMLAAAKDSEARAFALILTQREKEKTVERLLARGFAEHDFCVRTVLPTEIPRYMSAGDAAISFIKACYSKQSSSPTKIAEYLASGLPIVCNRGVGDIDDLIERKSVGVLIDGFSRPDYLKAVEGVIALGDQSEHCRNVAREEFDLGLIGGVRYRRLYRSLLNE